MFQFSRTADGDSVTVSRIRFRPKSADHMREVTCRAENTEMRGSAIEDTIRLRVHCKYHQHHTTAFRILPRKERSRDIAEA